MGLPGPLGTERRIPEQLIHHLPLVGGGGPTPDQGRRNQPLLSRACGEGGNERMLCGD